MTHPANHLDDMIVAAKRELDDARMDGDATRICRAVAVLDGRRDRRIRERQPKQPMENA